MALQKIGATGKKLKSVGSSIEGVGQKLMLLQQRWEVLALQQ